MISRCIVFNLLLFKIAAVAYGDSGGGSEFFLKGLGLKDNGQLTEAEGQIKKALELEPANPDYHFELANVYAMRHDARIKSSRSDSADPILEQIARELEQAVMLRPDFLPAHYNLGVVYKKQGRYEKAREAFRSVLALNPKQLAARMQTGVTYEEQGFFDEAESIYREARGWDDHNPEILAAIEDLKRHRDEARRRTRAEDMTAQMSRLNQNLRRASVWGEGLDPIREGEESSQRLTQAIPYLGAWLAQEFMKRRSSHVEDP